jgi:hypothetical protein
MMNFDILFLDIDGVLNPDKQKSPRRSPLSAWPNSSDSSPLGPRPK